MADGLIKKYYKDLGALFRDGPIVRHKINSKVRGPGDYGVPVGTARAFLKNTNSAYASTMASYGQYNRLARYCLKKDQQIQTLRGVFTIGELTEMYPNGEKFEVYSFDIKSGEVVIGWAHHPHFTKTSETIKLTLDNGGEIVCTPDHRFLMRDGTYKEAKDIKLNEDSIMPLRKKDFYGKGYQWIYTIGSGWKAEHKLVCEWKDGRKQKENEVVHHIDRNPSNNAPENLVFMDRHEHASMHGKEGARAWELHREKMIEGMVRSWSENYDERCLVNKKSWENNDARRKKASENTKKFNETYWTDETRIKHSAALKKVYSTPEGKKIQSDRVKEALRTGKLQVSKNFSGHWKGKSRSDEWRLARSGKNAGQYKHHLDYKTISESAFANNFVQCAVSRDLNCTPSLIARRVKSFDFSNWREFCKEIKECRNHKVVKVESDGVQDVYDMSVDDYHNFAVCDNSQPLIFIANSDYNEMESMAEIGSALDIYSDECTAQGENGEIIKIESDNKRIRQALQDLFYDTLNLEFEAWNWIRNMCKYGDQFLLIDHHPDYGVLAALPLPVNEIEREEGYDEENPLAFRYRWITQGNKVLENWQIIHFRLSANDNFLPYGSSILEVARRSWRQLILMEDAVMVYRIVRSPERRVFKIDVGNIAPVDVPAFMEKARTQLKRNQIVDSNTGRVDLRYNPLSTDEDYFIPIRGEHSSHIETLPGGQFTGDIDDLKYIQNKLFAALKIPKSYLGYEEDINAKSTLSQQDVRFARTIQRIQRVFVSELNKIAIIHLFSMGFSDSELTDFEISMANPSSISELQRLELLRTKFEVAAMIPQNGIFDKQFGYDKVFKLPPEDVETIEEGRRKDHMFDLEIMAMQPPTPIAPGQMAPGMTPMGGMPGMMPGQMAPGMGMPPAPAPAPLQASKDPNIQNIAPNELYKIKKPKRDSKALPDLSKGVFGLKKTAMDIKRNQSELGRLVKAPFGESVEQREDKQFRDRHAFVKKIAKDLQEVDVLRQARDKKKKKVIKS